MKINKEKAQQTDAEFEKLENYYNALGEKYYQYVQVHGCPPEFEELIHNIRQTYATIENMLKPAPVLNPDGNICFACGNSVNEKDKFCPHCGVDLSFAPVDTPTQAFFDESNKHGLICPNCQIQLDDDAAFCYNCGCLLSAKAAANVNYYVTSFCVNCGKKLEKDELFCSNCGTKVEN